MKLEHTVYARIRHNRQPVHERGICRLHGMSAAPPTPAPAPVPRRAARPPDALPRPDAMLRDAMLLFTAAPSPRSCSMPSAICRALRVGPDTVGARHCRVQRGARMPMDIDIGSDCITIWCMSEPEPLLFPSTARFLLHFPKRELTKKVQQHASTAPRNQKRTHYLCEVEPGTGEQTAWHER